VFVIGTDPAEDWPTRLRRAAVTDVYEVRLGVEVQVAGPAVYPPYVGGCDGDGVRAGGPGERCGADGTAFVDVGIAFHAAVVAAAHNPVLADLFGQFRPVPREGLVDLLALTGLRQRDPNTGDRAHEAPAGGWTGTFSGWFDRLLACPDGRSGNRGLAARADQDRAAAAP
jgi:GntR family transcriptional repressor for pyruvate dehydrogenase complex